MTSLPLPSISGIRTRSRAGARSIAAAALPWAALVAYAAVAVAHGPVLSAARFLDSDVPGAVYAGATLFSGSTTLPVHSEIAPTLLGGALLALPGGHILVSLLGPALGLLCVGLMCAAVRQLGAAWPVTAVMGVAAGPIVLASVVTPTAHVFSFAAAAALSLVALRLPDSVSVRTVVAAGAVGGVALAGDQGFLAIALLPFAAAALAVLLHDRGYVLRHSAGLLSVAVVVAAAIVVTLRALHVSFTGDPLLGAAGFGRVPVSTSAPLAAHTFGWMLAGTWFAPPVGGTADALLAVLGCAVPLVAPLVLTVTLRRDGWQRVAAGKLAYLVFWTAADLLVLGLFLVLGYAQSKVAGRYLIPCLLSAIATLPLAARAPANLRLSIAAAAFAALQALGIWFVPGQAFAGSLAPTDGPAIIAAVRDAGLTRGFAAYSDSHALTWLSAESVHVYPVSATGCPHTLCAVAYSTGAWYRSADGSSFLLVRHSSPCVNTVPPGLGTPIRTIRVDDDVTVFVYSSDISIRIDPASRILCP